MRGLPSQRNICWKAYGVRGRGAWQVWRYLLESTPQPIIPLILPTLLHCLPHPLGVFFPVVLVEVRRLDVGRRASIRVVKQTVPAASASPLSFCIADSSVYISPLNARQDSSNIVRRAPAVLQDVQAQLPGGVDVGVEHLADELDGWRLVGVLLLELHHESESSVLEGRVCWSDDDGVPVVKRESVISPS